jgi:hypothetical protein
MSINEKLPNFALKHLIDNQKEYSIEYIPAKKLLISNRIDLIAKYKYVEFYDNGYDLSFIQEVYKRHLEAFSYGTFTEIGQEKTKKTIQDYTEVFHRLIKEIKSKGVDESISIIPVGTNNIILDGSHRTAIAAYFNQTIPIVRFDNLKVDFGTEFFRSRLLDDDIIDYLVTEYCRINDNIYSVYIWPKAKDIKQRQEAFDILNTTSGVIYKKNIALTHNGLRNLMLQIYANDIWVGTPDNHYKGVLSKVEYCYDKKSELTIFFMEGKTKEKMLLLKDKIRSIFQLEKNSIHSTDNIEETVLSAHLLLNKNSVHLLNYGYPDKYNIFCNHILEFCNILKQKKENLSDIIVASSSILGLYGLRNVGDIDYLTLSGNYSIENSYVERHDDYAHLYETTVDQLILNPNNYAYCFKIKFITLDRLLVFKKNRGSEKDKHDLKLIRNFLFNKKGIKYCIMKYQMALIRTISNKKHIISLNIIKWIVTNNIYIRRIRPVYKKICTKNSKIEKIVKNIIQP